MKFFDLGVRSGDPEVLRMAKVLGFSGVGILQPFSKGARDSPEKPPLQVVLGVEMQKASQARDVRREWELIAVRGDDRNAVETPQADIVFPREINHVLARLAKKNNVAIGFEFSALLHSSKRGREEVLARYFEISRVARKHRTAIVMTSGALSAWDLRSPSDLIAFGKVLGFSESQALAGLSGRILEENRKRLGKKWIAPGIELD